MPVIPKSFKNVKMKKATSSSISESDGDMSFVDSSSGTVQLNNFKCVVHLGCMNTAQYLKIYSRNVAQMLLIIKTFV